MAESSTAILDMRTCAPAPFGSSVRDADLIERIRDTTPFLRPAVIGQCEKEQLRRDGLSAMTDVKRRRAEAHHRFHEEKAVVKQDVRFIHSVLAICSLPYQRPPAELKVWEKRQGRMSLVVRAGGLQSPDGKWVEQSLPWGSRGRLVQLHMCNEAMKSNTPEVEMEESFSAFLGSLGYRATGGPRGTVKPFKEQIQAFGACSMQIGVWNGSGSVTYNTQPIKKMNVWLPQTAGEKGIWNSKLTFDQDFFDTLKKHALPVNIHAVRAFANSPRKLDIYWWMGHRLHGITKTTSISWAALKEQFGMGYTRERRFRSDLAQEIKEIMEVFPRLPIKVTEDGFVISPGAAEVLALPKHKR